MTEEFERRVPLENRIPPGEQSGTCKFPLGVMGETVETCGRPVYAKSQMGRLPMYCGEMVNGVLHNGKNAAKARDQLGIKAAPPKAASRPASPEEGFVTATASVPFVTAAPAASSSPQLSSSTADAATEDDRVLLDQLEDSVVAAATKTASSSTVQHFKPRETGSIAAAPSAISVSKEAARIPGLVEHLERAATVIAQASTVIAPQIVEALKAMGAAGAAEEAVIEAKREASVHILQAKEARVLAEEMTAEANDRNRKMAVTRSEARAAAEQAAADVQAAEAKVAEVQEEARAAIEAAAEKAAADVQAADERAEKAQADRTRAEGEAEELRRQVAELKNQLAEQRRENLADLNRLKKELADLDKLRGEARLDAERAIGKANAAQVRAEGEAEELRRQVAGLVDQLKHERQERQAENAELHEYYRRFTREQFDALREAYEAAGRAPVAEQSTGPADPPVAKSN